MTTDLSEELRERLLEFDTFFEENGKTLDWNLALNAISQLASAESLLEIANQIATFEYEEEEEEHIDP